MDEMFIRQVVYDDGLNGVGDREKLEKIYEALNVPEDSVATKTKVNVRFASHCILGANSSVAKSSAHRRDASRVSENATIR